MKKIHISTTTIALLFFGNNFVFSQKLNVEKSAFSYSMNSGIGIYAPININNKIASNGLIFLFQIQAEYKKKYFSRLIFNQFSLGYNDNISTNNTNIKVNDRLETTIVGLDFGYTYLRKNNWSTYFYAGMGSAIIYSPQIKYENSNIELAKEANSFLSLNTGIGIEYSFNKLLILKSELQYLSIANYTNLFQKQLNGTAIQIGFKTTF